MSSNEPTSFLSLHFMGQEVRIETDKHGEIWWVARDVAEILGLVNVHTSLSAFPEDEKGIRRMSTPGGPQSLLTVNEPGLYRLIFQSRKPEAENLKRWVYHNVLPTMRKTGRYEVTPHLPAPIREVREHAEVSTHLLAVWRVLRQADEPLANREIAKQAGVAGRTARAHTKYLFDLGLLDTYKLFPRHLYAVSEQAEKRHAAYWQRLERLAAIVERRHGLNLIHEG